MVKEAKNGPFEKVYWLPVHLGLKYYLGPLGQDRTALW